MTVPRRRPARVGRPGRFGRLGRLAHLDRAVLGVSASFAGLATTLAIQVVQVPLFLHLVGVRQYAVWLVLTAIPTYLGLSDLGFSGAASTDAAQRLVAGDPAGARRSIQSAWTLVMSVVAVVAVVGVPLVFACYHGSPAAGVSAGAGRAVVLAQLVAVAAWIQAGFVEGSFRANGQYPFGICLMIAIRVLEFAALGAALALSHRLWVAAAVLALTRVVLVSVYVAVARARMAWFALGWSAASRSVVARLALPSLTYSGFTFGFGILNQGYLLLAASALRPAEVVAFTTVRTIVNSTQQVTVTVTNGVLGELTRAVAAGALARARTIVVTAARFSLLACGAASLLLLLVGEQVVAVWTDHRVHPDRVFLTLMVLTVLADVPWQLACSVLRSANRHQVVGVVYLATCAASLAAARLLLPVLGLDAAPISLFLLDVVVTPVAVVAARRLLRGGPGLPAGRHLARAAPAGERPTPTPGSLPRAGRRPSPDPRVSS